MSGPQAAAGEAGSGRWDTGLQLPGSRCSAPLLRLRGRRSLRKVRSGQLRLRSRAPRPACISWRIGARCAAGGRPGLRMAAGVREAGGDQSARSKHPGYPCPGPSALNVKATTIFYTEIPKPRSRSACPYGGGNDFPAKSLKETSAHNKDGNRAPPPSFCLRDPVLRPTGTCTCPGSRGP